MYLPFKELADPLKVGSLVVYENNGVPIIGTVVSTGSKKHRILNQQGTELELQPERLVWLSGEIPSKLKTSAERASYLRELIGKSREASKLIDLESLWSKVVERPGKFTISDLSRVLSGSDGSEESLTLLLCLYNDKKFFKRVRHEFEPRDQSVVEELRASEQAAKEKREALAHSISAIKKRLEGSKEPFPASVLEHLHLLEGLALDSPNGSDRKLAREFLDNICAELGLKLSGPPEAQSLELLCLLSHITPTTDLIVLKYHPRQRWNAEVVAEEVRFRELREQAVARSSPPKESTDLSKLNCFTIDDIATNDMDDALSVERIDGGFRVGIHISNVVDFVTVDSAIDKEARRRGTSIYCPNQRINMLPEILAEDLCSLRAKSPRLTLSVFVKIDGNFRIISHELIPGVIEVKQRFTYDDVDAVLLREQSINSSEHLNLETDLETIYQFASAFEQQRLASGGLKVSRRDIEVSVTAEGQVQMKEFDEDSPARSMVGEMMILANMLCAEYGIKHKIPLIFRSQADPDQDPYVVASDVPHGPAYDYALRSTLKPSLTSLQPGHHSTLGLRSYIQITSPIRRYADLCNQRQLLAQLRGESPPYNQNDLGKIIDQTEEILGLARSISRESKRYWILRHLEEHRNDELVGTVIRTDLKNPLVEIDRLYITLLAHLNKKPKLGDRIKLRIAKIDSKRDLIRLEEF